MANSIKKNVQKTSETGIIAALSTLAVWAVNKYVVDLPSEASVAAAVVLTGIFAGIHNFLKHGPVAWPWKK